MITAVCSANLFPSGKTVLQLGEGTMTVDICCVLRQDGTHLQEGLFGNYMCEVQQHNMEGYMRQPYQSVQHSPLPGLLFQFFPLGCSVLSKLELLLS